MAVASFLRWWGSELAAFVPHALRPDGERGRTALRLQISPHEIVVLRASSGRSQELGRVAGAMGNDEPGVSVNALGAILRGLDSRNTKVVVELSPDLILTKTLELPLAAEENLRQVLSFEMERQTPFRPESVYFDYLVAERSTREQRICLNLFVARREAVDDAMALLEDWDLQPGSPHVELGAGPETLSITFLPVGYRAQGGGGIGTALVIVNAMLLAAVIGIPIAKQDYSLTELGAELAQARESALAASELEERIRKFRSESGRLLEHKTTRPAIIVLLNELGALLPDSTWLQRLDVKGGRVHLRGTSDAASSLIARLEASDLLGKVQFDSPVTEERTTGRERFHISAAIAKKVVPQ